MDGEFRKYKEKKQLIDGKEVEFTKVLTDDDFLYLQDNYIVTLCAS